VVMVRYSVWAVIDEVLAARHRVSRS